MATCSFGAPTDGSTAQTNNRVVQWNRALLLIVRTHGAQPATVHPTRSFALMHAAIYDAVNAIARTHRPYLVDLPRASRPASQEAAAAAAAHEVLSQLYPAFQATLDAQLQQELAQIPDGAPKTDGINIGQGVAALILDLLSDDGSSAPPVPYVFGNASSDYQSTPPNFPAQPPYSASVSDLPAGTYTFSAVATDNDGSKATDMITISVVTPGPINLSAPQFVPPASFQFSYSATVGLRNIVQRSPDLTQWNALSTNTAASGSVVFTDQSANGSQGCYRVGLLPNP